MKIENISYHEIKPKKEKKIDVQNADEYFDDICQELFSNEDKYLVDPKYMSNQSDINHRMRAILIDWLIDVHLKYKLVPQTMYIAVNLIDRYLEKNETNRAKLQLVGVTAMFIACKYEEIYPPDLKDFVYITDGAYVKQDVLDMEYKMLKSLEFNITFPTQWSIFEIYKKKLDLDDKTFKLAWFLMELCLIDYKILKFKMSYIAASAILIAIKTLGIYRSDFSSVIGIEENQLEECCKEIYNYYVYNSTHNLQAIRKKFAMTRYNEVSKIKLC
jgi:cyclin B